MACYQSDFYEGRPALTVNRFGQGEAYYIAGRTKDTFHTDFYRKLVSDQGIRKVIDSSLPLGVTAQMRTDGEFDFVFIMNFSGEKQEVHLDYQAYENMLTGEPVRGVVQMKQDGICVLKRPSSTH